MPTVEKKESTYIHLSWNNDYSLETLTWHSWIQYMPSAELYITLGELDCRAIIRSEGQR